MQAIEGPANAKATLEHSGRPERLIQGEMPEPCERPICSAPRHPAVMGRNQATPCGIGAVAWGMTSDSQAHADASSVHEPNHFRLPSPGAPPLRMLTAENSTDPRGCMPRSIDLLRSWQ